MTVKELLEDLLIEFDELDMQPMILVPDPVDRAKAWKHELTYAIRHLKAEVAREIFNDLTIMFTLHHGFNENHIVAHIDFEALKELKKKYMEGE